MKNQNNVVIPIAGQNITGNIGSCAINANSYSVSFFTMEVVAVNSCTGEIISREQMTNGSLFVGGIFVFMFLLFFCATVYSFFYFDSF